MEDLLDLLSSSDEDKEQGLHSITAHSIPRTRENAQTLLLAVEPALDVKQAASTSLKEAFKRPEIPALSSSVVPEIESISKISSYPKMERPSLTQASLPEPKHAPKSYLVTRSVEQTQQNQQDCATEPFSGIRIKNRLVSSQLLKERMETRIAVRVGEVQQHMRGGRITKNWVLFGVLHDKSSTRTAANGKKFITAKLTNMNDQHMGLFFFDDAYLKYRFETQGSILALLNPEILKPSEVH